MTITTAHLQKIRQVVRCFETGVAAGADYGNITVLPDGPGNRLQITYGASQTTEYGLLKTLLQMYVNAGGKLAGQFKGYIPTIGNETKPSLASNATFMALLKAAAQDKIMQETQDRFFAVYYLNPARQWFEVNRFALPLSLLVIYDSYVHSGKILMDLRNRFAEKVPAAGGDEKKWITSYVDVRDQWLETNKAKPILQKTDYRTDSFIYAIRMDNWLLDKPFYVVNYPDPQERLTPSIRYVIP